MIEEEGYVHTHHDILDDTDDSWKYTIDYYSDGTEIKYLEKDEKQNKWVEKDKFWITAGFDKRLFHTAYDFLNNWKEREL